MSEFSVQLRNVTKRHGSVVGVEGLSLEIRQGEFFSILGPSGSGKTTALRLIAGLDQPDQGEIVIQGQAVNSKPANLRPVNMVFQNYALFPHMTVFQNVGFGLQMQGRSPSDITSHVEQTLELVKLKGKGKRLPSQLSGGEQQRVALARALVNRPAVLLLDEPLGALDQQLRQEMQMELKQIQEQVRSTFICVTHHQEEALMLSDRVAVMDRGRVWQVGTPQEVYDSPVSTFVAGFVGLSNTLHGRVTLIKDSSCWIEAANLPRVQVRSPVDVIPDREVTVIVRPERLHLSQTPERNGFENSLPAKIQKVTFHGSEMVYRLNLVDGMVWTARVRSPERNPQEVFRSGQPVYVQWNADAGLVLTE